MTMDDSKLRVKTNRTQVLFISVNVSHRESKLEKFEKKWSEEILFSFETSRLELLWKEKKVLELSFWFKSRTLLAIASQEGEAMKR